LLIDGRITDTPGVAVDILCILLTVELDDFLGGLGVAGLVEDGILDVNIFAVDIRYP